jgi:hypothetical protein
MTPILDALADAQTEFQMVGGYDVEAKVAKVLAGGWPEALPPSLEFHETTFWMFLYKNTHKVTFLENAIWEPSLLVLDTKSVRLAKECLKNLQALLNPRNHIN